MYMIYRLSCMNKECRDANALMSNLKHSESFNFCTNRLYIQLTGKYSYNYFPLLYTLNKHHLIIHKLYPPVTG